ncbi:hypothetical protein G9A89_010216 [Geosiphon pyriformis]|nr:hypothetical protein G9A89_010216 [Geosiphon pyriformis]
MNSLKTLKDFVNSEFFRQETEFLATPPCQLTLPLHELLEFESISNPDPNTPIIKPKFRNSFFIFKKDVKAWIVNEKICPVSLLYKIAPPVGYFPEYQTKLSVLSKIYGALWEQQPKEVKLFFARLARLSTIISMATSPIGRNLKKSRRKGVKKLTKSKLLKMSQSPKEIFNLQLELSEAQRIESNKILASLQEFLVIHEHQSANSFCVDYNNNNNNNNDNNNDDNNNDDNNNDDNMTSLSEDFVLPEPLQSQSDNSPQSVLIDQPEIELEINVMDNKSSNLAEKVPIQLENFKFDYVFDLYDISTWNF